VTGRFLVDAVGLTFDWTSVAARAIHKARRGDATPLLSSTPPGASAIAGLCWWQRMLSTAEENAMPKLTDTQLIVLSRASQRDDGAAVVPDRMNRAAAAKIEASLVAKKLMREVRAKPGVPVWRTTEDGRALALLIMRAGRDALGVEEPTDDHPLTSPVDAQAPEADSHEPLVSNQPRSGTKQALIVSILSARSGASLIELMEATGWLPHTTRAALTGLRQRGYVLERMKQNDQPTSWRIASPPTSGQFPAVDRIAHLNEA
jgi:hypothetical protein